MCVFVYVYVHVQHAPFLKNTMNTYNLKLNTLGRLSIINSSVSESLMFKASI